MSGKSNTPLKPSINDIFNSRDGLKDSSQGNNTLANGFMTNFGAESQILRALIPPVAAIEMHISRSPNNSNGKISVKTEKSIIRTTDRSALYLFDVKVNPENYSFEIPNDIKKYWWIPFDTNKIPLTISGGFQTVMCACLMEPEPGIVTEYHNSTCGYAKWINEIQAYACIGDWNCQGCCDVKAGQSHKPLPGSGVIMAGSSLNYNGKFY